MSTAMLSIGVLSLATLDFVSAQSSSAPADPPTVSASPSASVAGPESEPVVLAVQKALPTVININTERVVERFVTTPYHAYFGRYFVQPESVKSLGSGMLVSPDGYIVTNHHVVEMADELKIRVSLYGHSQTYDARFIRSEPSLDLALIKVDAPGPVAHYNLRDLSPNLLGQTVIALGNPVGYQSSVSRGILSAKNREFNGDGVRMTGLLQTDAAINPGNSGGPLVDIKGSFVGLNTAKFASVAVEGIGFAIPGNIVVDWVEDAIAIAEGKQPDTQPTEIVKLLRQRLGLSVDEVSPQFSKFLDPRRPKGVMIADVEYGSPSHRAGLATGLIISEINSDVIDGVAGLPRELLSLRRGDVVNLEIIEFRRNGNTLFQRPGRVSLRAR